MVDTAIVITTTGVKTIFVMLFLTHAHTPTQLNTSTVHKLLTRPASTAVLSLEGRAAPPRAPRPPRGTPTMRSPPTIFTL